MRKDGEGEWVEGESFMLEEDGDGLLRAKGEDEDEVECGEEGVVVVVAGGYGNRSADIGSSFWFHARFWLYC